MKALVVAGTLRSVGSWPIASFSATQHFGHSERSGHCAMLTLPNFCQAHLLKEKRLNFFRFTSKDPALAVEAPSIREFWKHNTTF
jgi:hypothetical protein